MLLLVFVLLTAHNMLLILFLVLLTALQLIFLLLLKKQSKYGKFHPPPGPKGLPFIGNLHQYDSLAPHIYLANLGKIYGPILFMWLGQVPIVVIQSAKVAKEVLRTQDQNFCTRPKQAARHKLSYNGLDIVFAPYNDYYREMKKQCVIHFFSPKKVQSFAHIRQEEVMKMINKVLSLSSSSNIVNLSELLVAFTSSNICRIAFGKRYEEEGIKRSRFHSLMNEIEDMFVASFFSDYFPLLGWVDKLSGLSSRLEKVFKDLDAFLEEIINDRLQQGKLAACDQKNITDVLLLLWKEDSFAFELTPANIKAVMMNIFLGGTNTSAIMVVWAMTELLRNPNVLKKVQKELRTMNRGKNFIEQNNLAELEYFKAVIKETLRLHPTAPLLISHEAVQKCSIQGYDILPKTLVYVNVWAIGRDSESWKDPKMFMPERFLGSHIDYKGHDFELLPFGSGRRMCPGMYFGVANFELALANLLYSFDWELPVGMKIEDIDTDTLPGISMHKKTPLCLVAKKSIT